MEGVQHLIQARRQSLESLLPDAPVSVYGDPVRLQQVVANLLSNASKYSPAETVIRIQLVRANSHAELRVIDEGDGIPPDLLHRVFEPFEQLGKKSESSGGGLGLGLAVSESLVRLHDGSIEVHSDGAGQGSEFLVRLPLADSMLLAGGSQAARETQRKRCRVVLIEDHRDARETLQLLLREDGFDVVSADSGPQGLALMQEHVPDVAIVDIGLPGMNGYEVAKAVRAADWGSEIFLVALTGFGQTEDRKAALSAGFNTHLTKPVDLEELENLMTDRSPCTGA